ncbi:MAG: class I SAM-dependent methyltransferase [Bacillota bacterium]|jgi:methyltransferase (TIGR00027 family)
MEENQISLTAIMSAYIRAFHAMYDTPKIFDDFLAYSFIPQERRTIIEQALVKSLQLKDPERAALCPDQATALAWAIRTMTGPATTLSRSRYTEDNLKKAISKGIRQYVILGAGLDTFTFRYPTLTEQLQVFEVDHPATQTFKRSRLAELGWELPAQLHFVPFDFRKDNLTTALTASGYDPQVKSFFSWLGVTMYLTRAEIFATLRSIASIAPAGSMVILDYLNIEAFIPEKLTPRGREMLLLSQQAGEQMKTGFDPVTLAADLKSLGFHLHENLSPADIQELYFQGRTDGYYASEHLHFAWAVVEAPPRF